MVYCSFIFNKIDRIMLNLTVIRNFIAVLLFSISLPILADGDHSHHSEEHDMMNMTDMNEKPAHNNSMETFDHPLARGSLNDTKAKPVMKAFIRDYMRAKKDRRLSTIEVFDRYIERLGSRRLTKYFEQKNSSCHGVLHNMGKAIAKRETNLINAVGICSDACTYACVHGAMKTIFAEQVDSGKKTVASVQKELVDICSQPPMIPDFFEGNCAHAAGHAYGIIGKERLSPALSLCTSFKDKEMRFYCEGGVYMQLMSPISRALFVSKKTSHKDNLRLRLNFCFHAGTSMSACMRFVLYKYNRLEDLIYVQNRCGKMKGSARRGCFNGLGYLSRGKLMKQTLSPDEVCQGQKDDREQCISGFAFVKKGHESNDKIAVSCKTIKDTAMREFCLEQNSKYLYQTGNPIVEAMY